MIRLAPVLEAMLGQGEAVAIVTVIETHGSTPRETGATMLVAKGALHGTIGGGQLEFHATDMARDMLANGEDHRTLPLTLGPHMGQCCGGRVVLDLRRAKAVDGAILAMQDAALQDARPVVLVFGAGHTGRALAMQLALLPLRAVLVDDRPGELEAVAAGIGKRAMDDPAKAIDDAAPGSAYVIMTHSHALDYRLTEAALRRGDAAYVGLIGSATKRARFLASLKHGGDVDLAPFACPIGGSDVPDKRPEIIAALAAAEVVRAVFSPSWRGLSRPNTSCVAEAGVTAVGAWHKAWHDRDEWKAPVR